MNTMKNRYFVFSKSTWKKTGTVKAIKRFQTRDEARNYKRTKEKLGTWGIWDTMFERAVR